MRIISGQAGGRRLFTPGSPKQNRHIRPTSDRAREAIYNIIGFDRVSDALVLDLFAGTGALGLEALSRGARESVFVDNFHAAVNLIRRNIEACDFSSKSHVFKRDLSKGLSFLTTPPDNFGSIQETAEFDLIFLDPPYAKEQAPFFLTELQEHCLIKKNGLVIYEDTSKASLPDQVEQLKMFDQRRYGDTGFWLYQLSEK